MKALKRLISALMTIITVAVACLMVGYVYIMLKYDIDLFKTAGQLKALSKTVDESALCPEAFSEADMVDVQTEVNKSVENMITYTEEYGYNVNFDDLPEEMKYVIKLTDKQVGALLDTVIKQEMNGKIDVGGKQIDLQLLQVDFSEITETDLLINTVVKLDITALTDEMQGFPFGYLKKSVPDNIYVSSTLKVTKGVLPFSYILEHSALTLNNLSAQDTEDLFHTLDVLLKIGSAKDLNEQIGTTLLESLIGSESQNGLAYSLKDIGAKDYAFLTESGEDYFAVMRVSDLPPDAPVQEHKHVMQHIESNQPTCTGEGNVEYWHCTGCGKDFADENGNTETENVTVDATGHLPILKFDAEKHWYECKYCNEVVVESQPHSSSLYLKNKMEHYKVCEVCGITFAEGAHSSEESCTICGYSANYEDKCASDYGFNYLGTLSNGENYQKFYMKLDEMASAFHNDETKSANTVTAGGNTSYVAGEINYSTYGLTSNEAMSVWAVYCTDHPLYYWISGNVVYSSKNLSLCVEADYKDGEERKAQNDAIYDVIDEYLNLVSGETSDYQIAFAFHDSIIDSIKYSRDELGNPTSDRWAHSILGVFVKKEAVCEGYAKAFSLLLNVCGVDNAYVTGTSNDAGHAWNVVQIEDKWYWYDLTWDDQPSIGRGIIYNYMCKSGSEFEDHTVGAVGDLSNPMNYLYDVPDASSEDYNSSGLEYGEEFTLGNFTYEVCGYNKIALVASTSSVIGRVNLSETVENADRSYLLIEIGKAAFEKNTKITYIFIPKSVIVINNFAFNGCMALFEVEFDDTAGWERTSSNGTFTVSSVSLEDQTEAATLLKETYNMDGYKYQYVWIKTVAV